MSQARGFTLVEVLVVLAIIGTVFGLAASGWFTMTTGSKWVQKGIDELVQTATRRNIFTTNVEAILPWVHQDNAQTELIFVGQSDALEFITARPSFHAGSAYMQWHWRIQTAAEGYKLQVHIQRFYQDQVDREPIQNWRDFLNFDEQPRFRFLEFDREQPNWLPEWQETTKLPVAIGLFFEEGPAQIIPLRHAIPAICASPAALEFDICQ